MYVCENDENWWILPGGCFRWKVQYFLDLPVILPFFVDWLVFINLRAIYSKCRPRLEFSFMIGILTSLLSVCWLVGLTVVIISKRAGPYTSLPLSEHLCPIGGKAYMHLPLIEGQSICFINWLHVLFWTFKMPVWILYERIISFVMKNKTFKTAKCPFLLSFIWMGKFYLMFLFHVLFCFSRF